MEFLIPPDHNFLSLILGTTLVFNNFIRFDLWSFVHFFTGVLIGIFVPRIEIMRWKLSAFWTALFLLTIWEIFEFMLWGFLVFRERTIDIWWDIAFGLIGFGIAFGVRFLYKKRNTFF